MVGEGSRGLAVVDTEGAKAGEREETDKLGPSFKATAMSTLRSLSLLQLCLLVHARRVCLLAKGFVCMWNKSKKTSYSLVL